MTKYDVNKCLFSLRFLDMIHSYENFPKKYLGSSIFSSPEKHNFASRAHYNCSAHGRGNANLHKFEHFVYNKKKT